MSETSPGAGTESAALQAAEFDTASSETVAFETAGSETAESRGPRLWRSLDELAETPHFRELLHREFPRFAAVWDEGFDRRRFLQLASASLAMAGLTACTKQPPESIVPYVNQPEDIVPGKPLFFATALAHAGYATGVLGESHMGRPTKIEGNPDHPASLGATDTFAQAAVLDLYDPDRSKTLVQVADIRSWSAFVDELTTNLAALGSLEGEGLRIVTGATSSPTLLAQIEELRAKFPKMRWHVWESAGREAVYAGTKAAFGEPLEIRYDLAKADVVLAVDSDFLTQGPGAVRYARDFAARRRVHTQEDAKRGMSRLYAVDSMPTATSTLADHRLALAPARIGRFLVALAAELGVPDVTAPGEIATGREAEWLKAVAEDLRTHAGRGLVVVGDYADPELHVLAHAINAQLGNLGETVVVSDPVLGQPDGSLADLVADMREGLVDSLFLIGVNPVYDAPADLGFLGALKRVRWRVHHGTHQDETAEYCQWHMPLSHPLESWSDGRAFDGTLSIGQPLIVPLYESKSEIELLAALLERSEATSEELVREHWRAAWGDPADFDARYRRALHDGLVADSAFVPRTAALGDGAAGTAAAALGAKASSGLELSFRPDPTIFDGRHANNAWLQECPKPLTKLTWDNALLMSPKTARELGFGNLVAGNDQQRQAPTASLQVGELSLEVAVWAVPGHADGALTLHLGYGRTRGGQVGVGAGVNASALRTTATHWRVSEGVSVTPAGGRYQLASTQDHHSMEGRDLVRLGTLAAFQEDEHLFEHGGHGIDTSKSLMDGKDFPYDGYAWGMTVDLGACTGCNACVVACQSENNIPAVGKDQVARGREMHWIRIDRYFAGESADEVEAVLHQPVLCQQCEQAPCEVVCPVAATVHSDEGLNDMVYNRCVGTRYCSNNCPYKVRRFNFLLYQDFETPQLKLGRNPDVTIRSRGVMEKCTYCVQRINKSRIDAKRDGRKIADGEIQTACQQACPSQAIVFGDINDPQSQVTQLKGSPLNYRLLDELGTRPRTTYLARLRNPNPALEPAAGSPHGSGDHDASETAHG